MRVSISKKQLRYVFQIRIQVIIPLVIIGGVWGYLLTGTRLGIYQFLFFSFIFAVVATITNNLDRIVLFFTRKKILFLNLHVFKLAILLVSVFGILQLYIKHIQGDLYSQENNYIWFVISGISAVMIGIVIDLLGVLQRMIGHKTILRYLSGRYNLPREEEHIFLFIDLKDSTAIAEKLGHKRFFMMINEIMQDVFGPVIDNSGDIYKYVGDELIVTWTQKKGIKSNNCLNLYFDVQDKLNGLSDIYLTKYGFYPRFKAGLHSGTAIVGEIGVIRSEIAYMGDAVNTAARIQAECIRQDADLLISEDLLKLLSPGEEFVFEKLGLINLKGKQNEIQLFKVTKLIQQS